MKRIIYTFVAALALVACTPDNGVSNKVRIAVSFEDEQENTKGQQRISAVDKGGDVIDVNWEEGDVLYYQKEGEDISTANPFEIVSGVGTKHAFFENEDFIGFENTFTLYYHGASTLNFENNVAKTQSAIINKFGQIEINKGYLMYTATNCKIGSGITLKPNFAILGVKITSDNATDATTLALNKKAVLGKQEGGSYIPYYVSTLIKEDGATELTVAPIYYFVFPYDYEDMQKNNYLVEGMSLWFANETAERECCNRLQFNSPFNLVPGAAQIITVTVKQNTEWVSGSSNVHEEYEIDKAQ